MIVEYVSVRSGKVLDRLTIDGETITYETGKAQLLVETITRRLTPGQVEAALSDWSNGHAQLRLAEQQ